jgi:hypothetical protein
MRPRTKNPCKIHGCVWVYIGSDQRPTPEDFNIEMAVADHYQCAYCDDRKTVNSVVLRERYD